MRNPPGHLIQHDRELFHSDIDDLLARVQASVEARSVQLREEWENHRGPEFAEADGTVVFLQGDEKLEEFESCRSVMHLAEELCILALYKKFELKTFLLVKSLTNRRIQPKRFAEMIEFVKGSKELEGFSAVDELRLLNNCIKHNGVVSSALATAHPHWHEDSSLENLGAAYRRLLPQVKRFVFRFAQAAYSQSKEA